MMFDFNTMDEQSLPGHLYYMGKKINFMYFAGSKARELEKTFQRVAAVDDIPKDERTPEEQAISDDGGRLEICTALAGVLESVEIKDFPLDGKKMAAHPKATTSFYSILAGAIITEIANGSPAARKSAK